MREERGSPKSLLGTLIVRLCLRHLIEMKRNRRRDRRNAFERARDATLAFDTCWWTSLAGAGLSKIDFSSPQFIQLGNNAAAIGSMFPNRRIVTYRVSEEEQTEVVTRPVTARFSALPVSLLELPRY